ncbi:MAG: hypothetical protein H7066_10595 [Cytophagaceae bacterium]|nr:hypothetical protein [Gemmatimonadaceae bacterium]
MRLALLAFLFVTACRDIAAPSVTSASPSVPLPAAVASLALVKDIAVNGTAVATVGVRGTPHTFASLVGHDAFSVDVEAVERSIVGRFAPGKVRVTFQLRVHNRLQQARFIAPTFPAPPDAGEALYLFAAHVSAIEAPGGVTVPGANVVEVTAPSRGGVATSLDWDGAAHDYVRSAPCPAGGSTCARYERYAAPLEPGAVTEWRRVGFDVDPTVRFIRLRLVLAADLANVTR